MKTAFKFTLAAIAGATLLGGCVTNDQGQLVIDQDKVHAVVVALNPPPPPPPPQPVIVEEVYQPMPSDAYVATVVNTDVFMVGGNTYIWVVGPDGARHRRFYAHGDHREEVFHRRDDLHRVMMDHGGRLPDHAILAHGPEHPGEPGHPGMGPQGRPGPGGAAVAHAALQKPAPAPAAKLAKDVKKS